MKSLQFFKNIFCTPVQKTYRSQPDLETLLGEQIGSGDVFGVKRTLVKLNRPFDSDNRLALIQGCLEHKKYAYAFYLTRDLPTDTEKKTILDNISKKAAYADDYSTARSAALLSEQMRV